MGLPVLGDIRQPKVNRLLRRINFYFLPLYLDFSTSGRFYPKNCTGYIGAACPNQSRQPVPGRSIM